MSAGNFWFGQVPGSDQAQDRNRPAMPPGETINWQSIHLHHLSCDPHDSCCGRASTNRPISCSASLCHNGYHNHIASCAAQEFLADHACCMSRHLCNGVSCYELAAAAGAVPAGTAAAAGKPAAAAAVDISHHAPATHPAAVQLAALPALHVPPTTAATARTAAAGYARCSQVHPVLMSHRFAKFEAVLPEMAS